MLLFVAWQVSHVVVNNESFAILLPLAPVAVGYILLLLTTRTRAINSKIVEIHDHGIVIRRNGEDLFVHQDAIKHLYRVNNAFLTNRYVLELQVEGMKSLKEIHTFINEPSAQYLMHFQRLGVECSTELHVLPFD